MEKGEVLAEYDATDNETLLLTVPDENGWDLYINGKKSTKYQAENTFIAVPVSKGHNTIQLRYHAPGLRAGIFSSILALGLFSFLSLSRNRHNYFFRDYCTFVFTRRTKLYIIITLCFYVMQY